MKEIKENPHLTYFTGTLQSSSNTNLGINRADTTIRFINYWDTLIETKVLEESIEQIFKRVGNFYPYSVSVFKVIYSCVGGKWNKSEPIFGEIIPSSEETYEF